MIKSIKKNINDNIGLMIKLFLYLGSNLIFNTHLDQLLILLFLVYWSEEIISCDR